MLYFLEKNGKIARPPFLLQSLVPVTLKLRPVISYFSDG